MKTRAHNSHVGDSRATENEDRGEFNVGSLIRQSVGLEDSFNVGFSTYTGTGKCI
jgi:erythromycin esterase-like protein